MRTETDTHRMPYFSCPPGDLRNSARVAFSRLLYITGIDRVRAMRRGEDERIIHWGPKK